MNSHPFQVNIEHIIALFGQDVIRATYSRLAHYEWQKHGWNCQPGTSCRIICMMVWGIDSPYWDLQLVVKFHFWDSEYSWLIFYIETCCDGWKDQLYSILRRSAHFGNHHQKCVDEHNVRRRTVSTNNTSDESRVTEISTFKWQDGP